jgi:hypothetical protein
MIGDWLPRPAGGNCHPARYAHFAAKIVDGLLPSAFQGAMRVQHGVGGRHSPMFAAADNCVFHIALPLALQQFLQGIFDDAGPRPQTAESYPPGLVD